MKFNEKKLIKNSFLLMIGNFSSKLLVFFLVPFYTTVLSTEEYGISDILVTTINLLYPFFSLMVETAVLRFCLENKPNRKTIFSTAFWIETIGFLILAPLTIILIPYTTLKDYLFYFLAYYFSHTTYSVLMNFVKGIEKIHIYSLAGVCNTIILISCNLIFLLKLDLGIRGYLLSMIIGFATTSTVLVLVIKAWRYIDFPKKLDIELSKRMIQYSVPLIPNSLSWWISNSSGRYILAFFRTMNDVGIYSVSYKIPSIITTVSNILINAWEISAVDEFGTENNRLFFSKMYRIYLDLQIVCCTTILVLLKPLSFVLFQKDFFVAWVFVPALLFASVFNTLNGFVGTIFTAAKKTKLIFTTTVAGALVNIIFNFCLIPLWGAQGAAIATAISYIVIYVLRMMESGKILKMEINMYDNILKLFLIGCLAFITCVNTTLTILLGILILLLERKFILEILTMIKVKLLKRQKKIY